MKKIHLLCVMAPALLLAMPASAQSIPGGINLGNSAAGGELNIEGQAPQACLISTPSGNGLSNATLSAGPTAANIVVTQLVDPATAVPQAATINMSFPVICNSAHRMTVRTRGGLVLQQAAPPPGPGFRNRLDYTVTATWAGQEVTGTTNTATPVQINSSNGAAGQLSLTIQIPAGGEPLVAGTYSDALVVDLLPAS